MAGRNRTYSRGSKAWGRDQRSGFRHKVDDLVEDGRYPGMLVHPSWREPVEPQEKLEPITDAISLRRISPDGDDTGPTLNSPNIFPDGSSPAGDNGGGNAVTVGSLGLSLTLGQASIAALLDGNIIMEGQLGFWRMEDDNGFVLLGGGLDFIPPPEDTTGGGEEEETPPDNTIPTDLIWLFEDGSGDLVLMESTVPGALRLEGIGGVITPPVTIDALTAEDESAMFGLEDGSGSWLAEYQN